MEKHFPGHGLDIKFMNFENGNKKSKGEYCKEVGITLMIDDDNKNALSCAENGVNVILLNRPWNIGLEHEKIIRVNDWKEIEKIIGVMSNGK